MTWEFSDFYDAFNAWVEIDAPSDEFKFWVMAWLFRMQEDPTVDAAPAPRIGLPWWFVRIPGAENDTHAVVCLYSIEDDRVRCSGITTLSKPII